MFLICALKYVFLTVLSLSIVSQHAILMSSAQFLTQQHVFYFLFMS